VVGEEPAHDVGQEAGDAASAEDGVAGDPWCPSAVADERRVIGEDVEEGFEVAGPSGAHEAIEQFCVLLRVERFEDDEERERQRVGDPCAPFSIAVGVGVDRLGQPRTDVRLTTHTC
jgi:hypothetical protein